MAGVSIFNFLWKSVVWTDGDGNIPLNSKMTDMMFDEVWLLGLKAVCLKYHRGKEVSSRLSHIDWITESNGCCARGALLHLSFFSVTFQNRICYSENVCWYETASWTYVQTHYPVAYCRQRARNLQMIQIFSLEMLSSLYLCMKTWNVICNLNGDFKFLGV